MHKNELERLWTKIFGFSVGDRVKYYRKGRKRPIYGDITAIDKTYINRGKLILYIYCEGFTIFNFASDVTKVQRRNRRK